MADEVKNTEAGSTTPDENQGIEIILDGTEDAEALKAKVEEANKKLVNFNQVVARAKKAEDENRKLKEPKTPTADTNSNQPAPQTTTPAPTTEDTEALILKSQGMSDELLTELKALAKVRGKGLLDTQSDPIFVAIKEKADAQAKSEKANLGGSHGSGNVKPKKDFNSEGLSDDEHKKMWREGRSA